MELTKLQKQVTAELDRLEKIEREQSLDAFTPQQYWERRGKMLALDNVLEQSKDIENPHNDEYDRGLYESEQWDGVGHFGEAAYPNPEPDASLDMYPR